VIGAQLKSGGTVANLGTTATITGGQFGVNVAGGAGTVTNQGTIQATAATGYGVWVSDTLSTFNNTVTNSGTIAGGSGGGKAVQFGAGDDLLVVQPGAVFVSGVDGGAGADTLELAAGAPTGTLSGLGSQFTNFGRVRVDAGAAWQLIGNNTIVGGSVLTNAGTLSDAGLLDNSGTIAGTDGHRRG
jgi:hypothetical protein